MNVDLQDINNLLSVLPWIKVLGEITIPLPHLVECILSQVIGLSVIIKLS